MTSSELRATASLAAIFSARLLGLFMIYPVFAAYAGKLSGATPTTIGLALGVYGLAQGLLQIPFGLLSDRIGRKAVIAGGLALFAVGSVVAALSHSIEGVLVGRALQGGGAIGSATLAFVADVTREDVRARAMAIVGMTIGLSFLVAIVLGPLIAGVAGVPGIFWLTAAFALAGLALLGSTPAPTNAARRRNGKPAPRRFWQIIRDRRLLRLDFSIFALHAILTSSFLAAPQLLRVSLHETVDRQWEIYLPVLAVSILLMAPAVLVAEKYDRMKEVFIASVALLGASLLALAIAGQHAFALVVALTIFFAAFNVMESILPSLVTTAAPADAKGAATGVYSSSQFFGIFFGGALGGWIFGIGGSAGVFAFAFVMAAIWLALSLTMGRQAVLSSRLVRIDAVDPHKIDELRARLKAVRGVVEVVVNASESMVYLKTDRKTYDADALARAVEAFSVPPFDARASDGVTPTGLARQT